MTKTTTMKMKAWNSVRTTTHPLISKLLQHRIMLLKRLRTRQTPKMEAMIGPESQSFSKMLMVDLETPLSLMEPALPMVVMAMAHHNMRINNTTMIVLITVVETIEAIVDTKVVKTMAAVAIIITDAMTTEATVVIDAKTTNTVMTVVAEATVITERIDVAATTTETEAVAKATMIKAEIEGMVSRIEVPEETIIVNSSNMISSIGTKLILNLIIDFTTRTILISSAGP